MSQSFKIRNDGRNKCVIGNLRAASVLKLPNRERLAITLALVNHSRKSRPVRSNRENVVLHAICMCLVWRNPQYLVGGKHRKLSLLNLGLDRGYDIQQGCDVLPPVLVNKVVVKVMEGSLHGVCLTIIG